MGGLSRVSDCFHDLAISSCNSSILVLEPEQKGSAIGKVQLCKSSFRAYVTICNVDEMSNVV